MPKGIINAKQKRAGSLGQSSKLFKMGNKLVAGGQGVGYSSPSIGSLVPLQTSKNIRTRNTNN